MDEIPPTIYRAAYPKAAKSHQCDECRGTIEKGEQYRRIEGLWDGTWSTFKVCTECHKLREDMGNLMPFQDLYQAVFNEPDRHPDLVTRFMDIRRKRNAPESNARWMEKIEDSLN